MECDAAVSSRWLLLEPDERGECALTARGKHAICAPASFTAQRARVLREQSSGGLAQGSTRSPPQGWPCRVLRECCGSELRHAARWREPAARRLRQPRGCGAWHQAANSHAGGTAYPWQSSPLPSWRVAAAVVGVVGDPAAVPSPSCAILAAHSGQIFPADLTSLFLVLFDVL